MKKYILPFILVVLFGKVVSASGTKTDSIPIMKRLVNTSIPADTKLRFLNKICAHYWTIDPDSSLGYGWKGLPLLKEKVSPRHAGYLHFVLGMAWENKGRSDSAMWYLGKAEQIFREGDEKRLYFRTIEQIGSLYRINGKYDTAVVLMNSALGYFKGTGDNFQIMSTLFNIGSVYLEQNRFNKALEYYQASAAYDSILNDTSAIATQLLGIGNIYLNLANLFKSYNPGKSEKYFLLSRQNYVESARYFSLSNHLTGRCFTSMSLLSSFIDAGMIKQADSILVADSLCVSYPDPRVSGGFRISQAKILYSKGKKSQALTLLTQVAGVKGEIMILPEFHEAMLLMAEILQGNGNRDSAWKIAERSLTWGRKNSVYPIAYKALTLMSQWSEDDGKTAGALAFNKEGGLYKDSLFIENGREVFDETELKLKNQSLREAMVSLEADGKLEKIRNLVIELAGAIALLLLAMVIYLLLIRSKRTNQKRFEAEQKMKIAEQEKKLGESAMENLRLAMLLNEQDLIYHTLQNADLNKTNQSMREKMAEFKFRFQKKRDQDQFSNLLAGMQRDAQKDPLGDFEVMFSRMHGGFFEKLLAVCPELSKAELQICALLRLNLSSKDIARLLNLAVASIDVTRSHIRKKLGLEQNQSLTSYLIMMG